MMLEEGMRWNMKQLTNRSASRIPIELLKKAGVETLMTTANLCQQIWSKAPWAKNWKRFKSLKREFYLLIKAYR